MQGVRRSIDSSFFFKEGGRKASTSAPFISPWRTVVALMMSRGDRVGVSVSGSEIAWRFDSPMISRIATQKVAKQSNQSALASVTRLNASREHWRQDQLEPGNLLCPATAPDRVVAHTEQETESVPFSEHAARSPVIDGDFPQHQIGAWMIVEGGGDNRGEGEKR